MVVAGLNQVVSFRAIRSCTSGKVAVKVVRSAFFILRLVRLDDERKQVLSEARKSANEEYVKIVEDANVKARQINEEAKQNAQNQKEQILKSVEGEIADMVVDATSKIVAGKTDNKALYDEFLNKAGDN